MTSVEPFGGALWFSPGQIRPHNLRSSRPDWVGKLSTGLPAERLPATLASLFSLCGHAHRSCATLAVNAALGLPVDVTPQAHADLARLTLAEHLRRIWLDWPQQLGKSLVTVPPTAAGHSSGPSASGPAVAPSGGGLGTVAVARVGDLVVSAGSDAAARVASSLAALSQCPALAQGAASMPAASRAWLETHALGMAAPDWLAGWDADPERHLFSWCQRFDTLPAALLHGCRTLAGAALPSVAPLQVHADAESLRAWAQELNAASPLATRQPRWHGACAETGVWTRLSGQTAQHRLDTPWLRLAARLAECVRLVLDDAATAPGAEPGAPGSTRGPTLSLGALRLAPGQAIAWVEMSRGLLIHRVSLDLDLGVNAGPDPRASGGEAPGVTSTTPAGSPGGAQSPAQTARVQSCQVIAPTEWNFHPEGAVAQALERLPRAGTPDLARRVAVLMAAYDPCVPCLPEPAAASEVCHA